MAETHGPQRSENKADMPWSTSQLAHRLGHRTHCMSPGTQGEPSSDWNRRTTLGKSIYEHHDIDIKSLGGSWKDPQPMAFRLLSGEPVACEAEIGKLALVIGVASCYLYVLSWNRADAPYAVTAPAQSNSECTIPLKEIESTANVSSKWGARNLAFPLPKYPEAQKVKKRCFHWVSRSGSAVPFFIAPRNYGTQVAVGVARAVLARNLCLELERVRLVSWGALLEEPANRHNRFMSFLNCGKPNSVYHPQDSQVEKGYVAMVGFWLYHIDFRIQVSQKWKLSGRRFLRVGRQLRLGWSLVAHSRIKSQISESQASSK